MTTHPSKGASSVTVDFLKKDAALEILPETPLLSSHHLGWNGIKVEHLHQPPTWETPEFINPQHIIAIHHFQKPVKLERTIDGKVETGCLGNGDVIITPANTPIKGRWDGEGEVTLLILEPSKFAQMAHESLDSDGVTLQPQFALTDSLLAGIGYALKGELNTNQPRNNLYINSLTATLAAHLLRHYCTVGQPINDNVGGLPPYQLRRAIDYIENFLQQNIKLSDIATALGMSQYYFARSFQQSMGIPPYQYLIQCRVERAKVLLKQHDLSITDIALECGFNSQSHLNQQFRKLTGITPKTYRDF